MVSAVNGATNNKEESPSLQPKLKSALGTMVDGKFVIRKQFTKINDNGDEETYTVDEPFGEEDLEDEDLMNTSRIDELNDSWNQVYGDIADPGTPRRVSFGAPEDIVVDRVKWSKKTLREARKGPWLKLGFMRKESCQSSWTVFD